MAKVQNYTKSGLKITDLTAVKLSMKEFPAIVEVATKAAQKGNENGNPIHN